MGADLAAEGRADQVAADLPAGRVEPRLTAVAEGDAVQGVAVALPPPAAARPAALRRLRVARAEAVVVAADAAFLAPGPRVRVSAGRRM